MDDVVELAAFGTTFEAQTAAAHLATEGIVTSVVTDDAGGAIPSMTFLEGGVRLLVNASDIARASELLEDWEADPVSSSADNDAQV